MDNQFIIENGNLSPAALKKKTELENNPASRTNHMEYMPGMERISSDIMEKVLTAMNAYEPERYTAEDVTAALSHDRCTIEDFKALLSPAAEPFLEKMAAKASVETRNHFGNSTYIFTPLYIANYCENYCVYCGFNCYNDIHRKQLNAEEIEHEMKVIADSGIEEILMLTGESKSKSSIEYIGEACKLARKYFRNVGLEIYPVNSDEYAYLHECGADYVTVFQLPCMYIICKENIHMRKCLFPARACARLSTMKKSTHEMSMKNSSVRYCVLTVFSCLLPESPFLPENRHPSAMGLSKSPVPRYLLVSAPALATTSPNMKEQVMQTAVTNNLKFPITGVYSKCMKILKSRACGLY